MNETLQSLLDREAIRELIYSYCRSVDRRDVALGHSIWHDDGYADYGEEFYQGPGKGSIDKICASHAHIVSRSHQVTNILMKLDADKAGSEAYVMASMRMERTDKLLQMDVWARYLDTWEKREGHWGLVRRVVVIDHQEVHAVQHDSKLENFSVQ